MVMVRPRGGDFCYSELEFDSMKRDVVAFLNAGAAGVVFGISLPNGKVDIERMTVLKQLSGGMKLSFHRAFDMTRDPYESLEEIISIGGIQRILTSGQDKSVLEGLPCLWELVQRDRGRISIMPGGGITLRNLERILSSLKVSDIHMSLMKITESKMEFRNKYVNMASFNRSEYTLYNVDIESVRQVTEYLDRKKE